MTQRYSGKRIPGKKRSDCYGTNLSYRMYLSGCVYTLCGQERKNKSIHWHYLCHLTDCICSHLYDFCKQRNTKKQRTQRNNKPKGSVMKLLLTVILASGLFAQVSLGMGNNVNTAYKIEHASVEGVMSPTFLASYTFKNPEDKLTSITFTFAYDTKHLKSSILQRYERDFLGATREHFIAYESKERYEYLSLTAKFDYSIFERLTISAGPGYLINLSGERSGELSTDDPLLDLIQIKEALETLDLRDHIYTNNIGLKYKLNPIVNLHFDFQFLTKSIFDFGRDSRIHSFKLYFTFTI